VNVIKEYKKFETGIRNDQYCEGIIYMTDCAPKVYFYIPSQYLIDNVPGKIDDYWKWIDQFIETNPAPRASGGYCTYTGPYTWTVQTYIYLRNSHFPSELTANLPEDGIIITHGNFLPTYLKPTPRQFIVEIKPDKYLQNIYSNFVIVQNKRDPLHCGIKRFLIKSAFVNNWPQPGLIPRDPHRADRFENICFMGNADQFLRDVESLESEIKKLGLKWIMMPREKWNDYSEVDAIVAVRPDSVMIERKPVTRLTNSWAAGVPAIVSPDIAFEDIRKSELDYLRARNVTEIVESIKRLMGNPQLRRDMAENGKKRAMEFGPEKTVRMWIDIIDNMIIPEYLAWKQQSPLKKILFFTMRMVIHKTIGIDKDER
jgi:hypothetical protein